MKKIAIILLVCLVLSGCGAKLADRQENGDAWDQDWMTVGTRMGLAELPDGFRLYEYNDVQGLDGVYYAAFVTGEGIKIKNDEGKDAELFPAQVYLLVQECLEPAEARQAVAQWLAVGESGYTLEEKEPMGEFAVYAVIPKSESPFVGGLLAVGIHNDIAVSFQLMCAEDSQENSREVLEGFLESLRFRAQEG